MLLPGQNKSLYFNLKGQDHIYAYAEEFLLIHF